MNAILRWSFIGLCLCSITCKETDTVYQPIDLLTDPSVMPQVIYTNPGNRTTGPYVNFSTTLTVRFNKLMDFASVQHAIHFSSPDSDLLPDTAALSMNQGDVASISPIRTNLNLPFLWKIGVVYTLRIDAAAKDVNGNTLGSAYKLTFTPEPYFRVKSISPFSGAVNISSSTVQLILNAPVDSSFESQVSILPALTGIWHYPKFSTTVYDSSQIIFQSTSTFEAGVSYTVSIPSGAADKYGDHLTSGFSSLFNSLPFAVVSTNPSDGTTGLSLSSRSINVTFSDSLDTSTVRESFSIIPPASGTFAITPTNPKGFMFTASANWLPDTVYRVVIDSSIRSRSGAKMPLPFGFSFMTTASSAPTPLRMTNSNPYNGDTTVTRNGSIYMYFDRSIDTASARAAFSISPPTDGLISFPFSGQMVFSPIRSFALGASYQFGISTSIMGTDGTHPVSPYSISFRIIPFEIESSYPSDGGTMFSSNLSQIQFIASDSVDITTAPAAVSISPNVNGTFYTYSELDQGYLYFNFSESLQPYTIYTVTVTPALHSQSGAPLAYPYRFSFATGQ